MERSRLIKISVGFIFFAFALALTIPLHSQQGILSTRTIGSIGVNAGQPVYSVACTTSVYLCVIPTDGTQASAGLALDTGNPGELTTIVTYGRAPCVYDNTPIQGNIAIVGNGVCHDSGFTNLANISNTQLVSGKILQVLSPTTALTNFLCPGCTGNLIEVSTIKQADLTTYIQAHQLTSAGPTGPTGATGATGATGTTGATGPAGVLYYNSAGAVANMKCFNSGAFTTTTSGTWTMSFSAASITTIRKVNAMPISPATTNATDQYVAIVNPISGSTISGKVVSGTGILLLGASSLIPITVAATIYVEVCGT